MCGRYLITSTPEAMRQLFAYLEQPNFPPRYNVAPTQPIPIVRLFEGKRQFALVRWGLIPAWVKDPKTFSLVLQAFIANPRVRDYALRRLDARSGLGDELTAVLTDQTAATNALDPRFMARLLAP